MFPHVSKYRLTLNCSDLKSHKRVATLQRAELFPLKGGPGGVREKVGKGMLCRALFQRTKRSPGAGAGENTPTSWWRARAGPAPGGQVARKLVPSAGSQTGPCRGPSGLLPAAGPPGGRDPGVTGRDAGYRGGRGCGPCISVRTAPQRTERGEIL